MQPGRFPVVDGMPSPEGSCTRPGTCDKTASGPGEEAWEPADADPLFHGIAWLRAGQDGTLRTGGFLSRAQAQGAAEVALASPGSRVYRGVSMAAVHGRDETVVTIPSPVDGTVIEVNQALFERAPNLLLDPCGEGWVARVMPDDPEDAASGCTHRHVVLLCGSPSSGEVVGPAFRRLGCRVVAADSREIVLERMAMVDRALLVVDAASAGVDGPAIVTRVNELMPEAKVIVLVRHDGDGDMPARNGLELEYRARHIFYYAVGSLSDDELVDVLHAAFSIRYPLRRPWDPHTVSSRIRRIRTSSNGSTTSLVVNGALLSRGEGLGLVLAERILGSRRRVELQVGDCTADPDALEQELGRCDRLLVLCAPKRRSRIPGSLVVDEDVPVAPGVARTATLLQIEPNPKENDLLVFDAATNNALTDHILAVMTGR